MPINIIQPSDLTAEEEAAVLDFFNSAESAQAIANTIEFPDELDIGINLARRLLLQRTQVGGAFESVEQIAATPYIGPERFSEIVAALTDRPLYDRSRPDINDMARELERLQRQMTRISLQPGVTKRIELLALEEPGFVGQSVPLMLRVHDLASGRPARNIRVTLISQWGYLTQYQSLGQHQGRVTEVTTDHQGEARLYHMPAHHEWLTVQQQDALTMALSLLDPTAATPADTQAGFQAITQRYTHERNFALRRAIDAYFIEHKHFLEQSFNLHNVSHQWFHEDVAVQAMIAGTSSSELVLPTSDDGTAAPAFLQGAPIEAQAVLTFGLKRWLAPWYAHLQTDVEQRSGLDADLSSAQAIAGDQSILGDFLLSRVHQFISGSRGLAEELISQRVADQSINRFINNGMGSLSSSTQAALFPALNIAAQTIRPSGMGTLAAVSQTRSDLRDSFSGSQLTDQQLAQLASLDNISSQFTTLIPRLDSFDTRYADFNRDYQSFDNRYTTFDNNYQSFNQDYQSFNSDYQSFNSDYQDFNTDYQDFRGDYTDFGRDYGNFQNDYGTFGRDFGDFQSDFGDFNTRYGDFGTRYSTFVSDADTLTTRMNTTDTNITSVNSEMTRLNSDMTRMNDNLRTRFGSDFRGGTFNPNNPTGPGRG